MSGAAPRSPRIITPMEQDYLGQEIPLRRLPQAPVRAEHVMPLVQAPVESARTSFTSVVEGLVADLYQ